MCLPFEPALALNPTSRALRSVQTSFTAAGSGAL
jgi:hypothetical protein